MPALQKTAVIVSKELSHWGSCRIITPNLQRAYELTSSAKHQVEFFSWTPQHSASETFALATEILQWKPTRLVFLDHMPHPRTLLEALCLLEKPENLPPVDFHIYGDFTLYAPEWIKTERLLKKMRVHFYCASHRQETLVASFLKQKKSLTSICPFPADPKQYYFSPDLRRQTRKQLGVGENEKMLLYTGRLSMQKNILRLTRELARFIESSDISTKFFLCGHFDQMGAPFFGVQLKSESQYFDQWVQLIQALPAHVQERISYIGNKNAQELLALYNAADLYASLSTHHDEDFGMSPLEALCSGTACLLSSWGGYASFALDENSCQLSPVEITDKGLQLSSKDFQARLQTLLSANENETSRRVRADFFAEKFSIESVHEKISTQQKNKSPRFAGFSPKLAQLGRKMLKHFDGAALFETGPKRHTFYFQIYKSYVQGLPSTEN